MEQTLQKLSTENESQYIWRIGQAKDAGLITATWSELSPILNKELDIEDLRSSEIKFGIMDLL